MTDMDSRPIIKLLQEIGGGKLIRNLSPMRLEEVRKIIGKDFVTFIANFFENLNGIDEEFHKLRGNPQIPEIVWKYINEAFRSYLCCQYIGACICSTIAVEAALKNIYVTKAHLDRGFTTKSGTKKIPEDFWEYVEWAHQVDVLPKHTKMFTDGMRTIRNDLAHANEFDANENAKLMMVSMSNILMEAYK